jgi:hypothetical protein
VLYEAIHDERRKSKGSEVVNLNLRTSNSRFNKNDKISETRHHSKNEQSFDHQESRILKGNIKYPNFLTF